MTQVRASVFVARPPEEVFAFIADPATATRWRTHLVSAKGASGAVGDRMRQTYSYQGKTAEIELEVSRYEPPERLEYKTETPVESHFAFHCRSEDGGTRVSMTISATVKGPAALFSGRIEKEAEQLARGDLAKLKAAVESTL